MGPRNHIVAPKSAFQDDKNFSPLEVGAEFNVVVDNTARSSIEKKLRHEKIFRHQIVCLYLLFLDVCGTCHRCQIYSGLALG